MTSKEAFEELKKVLSEREMDLPIEDNFVFSSTDSKELKKYYRHLMGDEAYMDPKRIVPRASYFCGEVWTLADECGNFVAVAHVVAYKAWKGSRRVWVWKGEVKYLDK